MGSVETVETVEVVQMVLVSVVVGGGRHFPWEAVSARRQWPVWTLSVVTLVPMPGRSSSGVLYIQYFIQTVSSQGLAVLSCGAVRRSPVWFSSSFLA